MRKLLTAVSTLLSLTSSTPATAQGFFFTQLTTTATACRQEPISSGSGPSISADGTVVAFLACQPAMGQSNPNVYVYDTTTRQFTQLTNLMGCDIRRPSVSGDGRLVTFASTCDHTGGNADLTHEIFLAESNGNSIRQLTDEAGFGIMHAAINDDGTRIAITAKQDLAGPGEELNSDLHLFDETDGFARLTMPPECRRSSDPSISADGTRIAFLTTCTTDTPPSPLAQQHIIDTTTGVITHFTHDKTCGTSCNARPAISADGEYVAFGSSLNLTGLDDGNYELYLYGVSDGELMQLTMSPSGCQNAVGPVAITPDGTRIAFRSTCDLTGGNSDRGEELFLVDTPTGALTQLTDTSGCQTNDPTISADGTRIALRSSCDLSGGNPTHLAQIFLAEPGTPPTPLATATATTAVTTSTPTPGAVACAGDCGGDGTVGVNELITLVNIALGNAEVTDCSDGVPSGAEVNIALIVRAVGNALTACPAA